jgi:hypothetical protein
MESWFVVMCLVPTKGKLPASAAPALPRPARGLMQGGHVCIGFTYPVSSPYRNGELKGEEIAEKRDN